MIKMDDQDCSDSSWCVVKQYVRVFTFPSGFRGVRDPRRVGFRTKFKGFKEIRIKKRLMFFEKGFDVRKLKHVDKIEKRAVGFSGRDWSDCYWPEK